MYLADRRMEKRSYILDKGTLRDFILANDPSFQGANLETCSITELVIIKTGIELKKLKEERREKEC